MTQAVNSLESSASDEPKATCAKHPALELLDRYRAVFGAAWAMRRELAGPRRLADEAAFLPAALSLQDTPVHPAPRRLAFALMALFCVAFAWGCIGEVDIVAIAPGRIVVSERTKLVQPLENSVVQQVLVKDGDHVVAGQPLVTLDPTAAMADKVSVLEQFKAAQYEALRSSTLLAAVQGRPSVFASFAQMLPKDWPVAEVQAARAQMDAEWGDIQARLAKFGSELDRRQAEIETARALLAKLEATLPLARQREEDFKKLSDQGFMAGHAGQDRTRERIELERDLATQHARLMEAQAAYRESDNARKAYLAEMRRALHDRHTRANLTRAQAVQEQAKAHQREKLTILSAPVAGTVQQLAVHTKGGVVTEAQVLMVIVPELAEVRAEVTLENKDIGFVSAGQEAEIKLETFNFTRYGTVPATVKLVTSDAVNDEKRGAVFPVTLQLHKFEIYVDGKKIKLSPGMNVTAEIKTEKRRVIEYLLSPVQRAKNESLRER
ncbi:HlyD family type I secretion periplasmic adaptor subunit [Pseudorhodoferax sp. Leaf265]|uniref:HlyD family type I secretion periplasmic adaptor subunit n=1 Tax=Pseudorhodoferax sp. Leaf265 TaxID=1736315 RepID=UPI0006FA9EAF|nr:HlyD family type I secretion periplasmic adaptor subunit [Pseudorhodoferax sp. Leaf265]KQP12396.1 hemolysin activation protein [Pseudorhodoferax sp. Leaf265]